MRHILQPFGELVGPLDEYDRYVLAAAVEGRSHQEVAAKLGTTPLASRLRRHRVLKELAASVA